MHPHQKRTLAEFSVDGNNLASGSYRAIAKSGMRTGSSDFAVCRVRN
jgi:hypothetical protein